MHCCQNLVQQKAVIIYEQTLCILLNHLKARECLSIGGWINKVQFWSLIEKYAHCKNVKQWTYKFWDGKPYHMELIKKSGKKSEISISNWDSYTWCEADEFRTICTVSVLLSMLCSLLWAGVWSVHLIFLLDCIFTLNYCNNLICYLIKKYFIQQLLI